LISRNYNYPLEPEAKNTHTTISSTIDTVAKWQIFNPCWGRKTPGHGEKISQVVPSYYSYIDPVAKWKIIS
jgi:hypothetical protein